MSRHIIAHANKDYAVGKWKPILKVLPEKYAEEYMWMGSLTMTDGKILYQYKHWLTRGYIILDDSSNFYSPIASGIYGKLQELPIETLTANAIKMQALTIQREITIHNDLS
jgi:hypothetical protein